MFGEDALPFGSSTDYTSTYVPDATGHHNVYIASNLPTGSIDTNNDQRSNILAKLPINAAFGICLFKIDGGDTTISMYADDT